MASNNGHVNALHGGGGIQTWTIACAPSGLLTANAPDPINRPLTLDELNTVENVSSLRLDFLRQMEDRRRNIRAECGIPERMPDPLSFLRLYEEDSLAGAVVERYPQETYKVAGEVWDGDGDEAEDDSPFERSWDELGAAIRGQAYAGATSEYVDDGEANPLWRLLMDWDISSRITGCGYLLIGIDDGRDLREPARGVEEVNSSTDEWEYAYDEFGSRKGDDFDGQIGWPNVSPPSGAKKVRFITTNADGSTRKTITRNAANRHRPYSLTWNAQADYSGKGARRLLYARVFTGAHVTPIRWERNRYSPRYGQPTHYHVDFGDPLRGRAYMGPSDTAEVHWTRMLPLASDARFRATVYEGVSAMWPVYAEIYNVQKIKAASGEGYYDSGLPKTVFKTPAAIAGAPYSRTVVRRQTVRDEWERVRNSLDKMMIAENLEPVQLAPSLVDPTPHVEANFKLIAVALNMPMRKLIGDPQGALAGAKEDTGDWDDVVRGRQRNHTIPRQVVPLVDRFRGLGLMPPPKNGEYKAGWPPVDALGATEKAQVFASDMTAIGTYIEKGGNQFMSEVDVAVRYLGMSKDEAEAMMEAAAKAEMDRHETDLEKQVNEQQTMIDEGLAPDPAMEHDAKALDLASKVRPQPGVTDKVKPGGAGKPPFGKPKVKASAKPPTRNEAEGMWDFDNDCPVYNKKISSTKLSGGRWVTLDNGVKVYLKSGKVVAGPRPVVEAMNKPEPKAAGGTERKGVAREVVKGQEPGTSAGQKHGVSDNVTFRKSKLPADQIRSGGHELSGRESADLHGRNFGEHSSRLSDAHKDAIGTYSTDAYVDINDGLRGVGKLSPEHRDVVRKMDEAMAGSKTVEPMKVYRGIKSLDGLGVSDPSKLVGKTFKDDGYTSTSTVEKVANGFAGKARFEIELPAGSRALSVDAALGSDRGLNQHEVVLPRGSRYEVTGVETKKIIIGGRHVDDFHVIKAKVVHDE